MIPNEPRLPSSLLLRVPLPFGCAHNKVHLAIWLRNKAMERELAYKELTTHLDLAGFPLAVLTLIVEFIPRYRLAVLHAVRPLSGEAVQICATYAAIEYCKSDVTLSDWFPSYPLWSLPLGRECPVPSNEGHFFYDSRAIVMVYTSLSKCSKNLSPFLFLLTSACLLAR